MSLSVTRWKLVLSVSYLAMCVAGSAFAADDLLEPRAEVGIKGGSARSLLTTEFWAPLAQEKGKVLYGDVRIMGDNENEREGNFGVGYRQVYGPTNSVVGVHGWVDRRHTSRNSNFHQLTFGAESLGDSVDLRANAYVPLNGARTTIVPGTAQQSPYLAGTGIFYDVNGTATEIPQFGVDAEAGYRVPLLQKQFDTLRIYGGGYHFFRDATENVTGFRVRTEAVVNPVFSVGARFQYDGPRGSQGFLEATLRFPFSAKKMYQDKGLYARLDESPERDVDIVTAAKIVPEKKMLPVINAVTGTQQRVLYVDNSNGVAGNGSIENPYSTLAAAQSALQANDILYIARGDGTSTNMNQGLTIDKAGVTVVGSGSNFIFDGGRFSVTEGANYSGTLLKAASLAPVLTNVNAFVDDGSGYVTSNSGNGIMVTADNASISGISVTNATASGIYVLANTSVNNMNSVSISNVTTTGSQNGRGILVLARDGATITNVTVANSTSNGNQGTTGRGIEVRAQNSSSVIQNATIRNNIANTNAVNGIYTLANNGTSQINNLKIDNNSMTGNTAVNLNVLANNSGMINGASVTNNRSTTAGTHGINLSAATAGAQMNNLVVDNNTVTGSGTYSLYVLSNTTGQINNATITNNTVTGGANYALLTYAAGGSFMNDLTVKGNNSHHNNNMGIYAITVSSQMNNLKITDNISDHNGGLYGGLYVYSVGGVSNGVEISRNTVTNNSAVGMYLETASNGMMDNVAIKDNVSKNNGESGLYLHAYASTGGMDHVNISGNTLTNNGIAGAYIQKDSGTNVMNVDLGGGTYGSTGQNRIFGNTADDIQLRYTGGGSATAQNNWWGVSTAPTRVTLTGGATIDTTNYLTSDPRP